MAKLRNNYVNFAFEMESISVIVPVFNRKGLVLRCLDSILNQTLKPLELIVVDNVSTDGTYEVVKEWMKCNTGSDIEFKLLKEEKKGACYARQKGFENSRGEKVIFFDSDDAMHPSLMEKASFAFKKNLDVDIVCWKCRIHQLDGTSKIPAFIPKNALESHLIHTLLRPQGYMVKREIMEKAGAWRKSVKVWNDLELGLRIILKDPKIHGIDEVLAEIYSQKESITGTDFSSREGEWENTLEEMDRENEKFHHPLQTRIGNILDYRRAILAAHYFREGNKEGANRLMSKVLRKKGLKKRLLLKFSFHYTRMGLRGAWRFVRLAI